MFKSIWKYILNNIFKVQTQTTEKEINDNQKYASEYQAIDDINFNAIFSNKIANYVINDSTMNITGDNQRTDLLNKTGKSMWKQMKKITSMALGYGGILIVPYVKGGKIYYNLVPQNRMTIDETDGDIITGATVLAERKVIQGTAKETVYLRFTNYKIENGNLRILQQFSDERGVKIPAPSFWMNIQEEQVITGVDRVLFGYIKSPINNRKTNDKYGVPITYGCDATILEIKDTMKQLYKEYSLKQTFVGVDATMFSKENKLPDNGLWKKFNADSDNFFEIFDPQFRDYTNRIQELYKRLEHEIGTSYGILSEVNTNKATATEIKRSLYDTFTLVDDTRTMVEKGLEDFFYSCNVLANAYNLSANGEYNLEFDWSYSLVEDSTEEFNQLIQGVSQGVISKIELRNWLKPSETIEESEKAIDEIENTTDSIDRLLKKEDEEEL